MYSHWTEIGSHAQERQQERIAEADEWRLAQRAAPAHPRQSASPSMWQALAATIQRFTTLRVKRAERAVA